MIMKLKNIIRYTKIYQDIWTYAADSKHNIMCLYL